MTYILCIETATTVCSVALCQNGEVISAKESHQKNAHSSLLTVFIEEALKEASINYQDLSAIAVSKGPGSYTGLRIGVSTAKGLCYALDIPLIGISTLQSMAEGMVFEMKEKEIEDFMLCPMIDARRMEVYTAVYNMKLKELEPVAAVILDENSFGTYLEGNTVVFGGDGAEKSKELIDSENAVFLDDFGVSARFLSKVSHFAYKEKRFEDTAYFEPFYLKEFIAGAPKIKGLR